jgi:lipid-A-disaccharide synthase
VNLELAQRARSLGIKVAYFSPPQVWAWGSWRVRALARSTDLVVCILPFEQPFLCARGCNARFLGNPLVDVIPESAVHNPHSPIPAPQSAFRIVIMPGSRPSEVERLRPMLLGVAGELRRDFPDLGVTEISCAQNRAERYRQMAMAGLIIAASGTATLEAALLQVPMIVVYCLSAPTYLLARLLVRLKHVSLPNLILGREVVPEFIQTSDQPILTCARNLLGNLNQRADISRQLAEVRAALGPPGAASRIAQAILGLVQARP